MNPLSGIAVAVGMACLITVSMPRAVPEDHLKAGNSAFQAGEYRDAERHYQAALNVAAEAGGDAERVAICLNHLAQTALRQGRYGRAESLNGRALDLLERALGANHPEVARCLNARAEVYRRLGLTAVAARLVQRSLAIREMNPGPAQLDLAESLETLGWVLMDNPNDATIRDTHGTAYQMPEILQRARSIRARSLVEDDAAWLPNLSVWTAYFLQCGNYSENNQRTEQVLGRAMSLVTKIHGNDHPTTADWLGQLGRLYVRQGKYNEAEAAQRKALAIWTRTLGPDHASVGVGLRNLAGLYLAQGLLAEADALYASAVRYPFNGLNDAELCHFFRIGALVPLPWREEPERIYEAYLTEMARRGGALVEQALVDTLQQLRAARGRSIFYGYLRVIATSAPLPYVERLPYAEYTFNTLEPITALRRAQQKPVPLQIIVEGPRLVECEFPGQIAFSVALRNLDSERAEVDYTEGGDYRSGRLARWRLVVHDADGRRLPIKRSGGEGGGLFQRSALRYGETWSTRLPVDDYCALPERGDYTVQILYHDRVTLVDEDFTDDLITCRSRPIRLRVNRRVIEVRQEEQKAIRRWLAALNEKDPVKVVAGRYGRWAHELVSPKSSAGEILQLGWKAVPTLLDELDRDRLTDKKRAWILALLFSITGRNDPRYQAFDVLGDFDGQDGPWEVSGYVDGEFSSGGSGFSEPVSRQGKIDGAKQRDFARCWQGWTKFLQVRYTSEPERQR